MISTLQELYTALTAITGFEHKVAYQSFPEDQAVDLPVIVYEVVRSDNFGGDNVVYHPINQIEVQLYTVNKDLTSEAALEAALKGAGIFWNKTETYLPDERCYQIIYEFSL